jgi:hypothetical protein
MHSAHAPYWYIVSKEHKYAPAGRIYGPYLPDTPLFAEWQAKDRLRHRMCKYPQKFHEIRTTEYSIANCPLRQYRYLFRDEKEARW